MNLAKFINFQVGKPSLLILGAIAALLTPFQPVQAAVIFQDNFDSESLGTKTNANGLTNWTVTDGSIDVIGPGFFDFLPGNGRYLDLDGTTRNAGKITSKTAFSFHPGDVITLEFDLSGNRRGGNDSVTVSLGSLFNQTFTLASSDPFTTYTQTINVTSATNAQLMFNHAGGDNLGLLLDDVSLTVQAVPEPLTILGAGTAIAFGTAFKRKLSKKSKKK